MSRKNGGGGRAVRLRLTPLEDRTLPAGSLATSLSSGILRITDYKSADTLVVRQTPTGVAVDSTDTHQSFDAVSRVMMDVRNDDTVTNNVSSLGTTRPREVYLSRRDTTGTKFVSSGDLAPGATSGPVIVTQPGDPGGPSTGADWFDKSLSDAGVRSLARTVAGDHSLDRLDMLALFAQVAKDGVVSANEIHDLKALERPDWTAGGALPQQTALFSEPDSVRALTSDVVDGDPANAHYQGGPLGNLQAGWTAAQFQKLVNKWFLGLDHPAAEGGTTYQQAAGSLFVSGPALTDVRQGNLGDCYFLAALGSLTKSQPSSLSSMFTDNGDGTFTVRFFNAGVAKYVTVDRMLPTNTYGKLVYDDAGASVGDSANELWVPLAEKAYAQMNEDGWLGHAASNSYGAIENGFSDDSLKQVANVSATWTQMIRATPAQLLTAVGANKPAILNSLTSPGNGVIGNHTYPVVGFDATTQRFNLSNPQGGFIQLTWTQITQSFSGFWAVS
jgi:hypothetical protein